MLLYGRLDRTASAGRFFGHGIPTPVQSVTITVGSNGVGLKLNLTKEKQMKLFASKHSHTQNFVKEHSPIYDLAAYQQRQRQLKRKKVLKNIFDTAIFISVAGLSFSTLFWGA